MNFISHHEVARRYSPQTTSPNFLFGSIMPDLARMTNTKRLIYEINDPEVGRGLLIHRLTNKPAFDDQPPVIDLENGLKQDFSKSLPARVATQASRVSKDLMFDGIQFDDPQIINYFYHTLDHALSKTTSLLSSLSNSENLIKGMKHLLDHGVPRYDDTKVVTAILYRTLDKTRTPIDLRKQDEVQRIITSHQATVMGLGSVIMNETVNRLQQLDIVS